MHKHFVVVRFKTKLYIHYTRTNKAIGTHNSFILISMQLAPVTITIIIC